MDSLLSLPPPVSQLETIIGPTRSSSIAHNKQNNTQRRRGYGHDWNLHPNEKGMIDPSKLLMVPIFTTDNPSDDIKEEQSLFKRFDAMDDNNFADDSFDSVHHESGHDDELLIHDHSQEDHIPDMDGEELVQDDTQIVHHAPTSGTSSNTIAPIHVSNDEDEALIQDDTQHPDTVGTITNDRLKPNIEPEQEECNYDPSFEDTTNRRRSRRILDKKTPIDYKQLSQGKSPAQSLHDDTLKPYMDEETLVAATDSLFLQYTPSQRDSVTVGDFVRSLEEKLNMSLVKDLKKLVKLRLVDLVTGKVIPKSKEEVGEEESGQEDEEEAVKDEEANPSQYDSEYEEKRARKKGVKKEKKDMKVRSKQVMNKRKLNSSKKSHYTDGRSSNPTDRNKTSHRTENENDSDRLEQDEEDSHGSLSRTKTNEVTSTRNRDASSRRMPSYLKVHLEVKRKRELAQAKVREEEIAAADAKKISEQDRLRAQLIARKFETDNDELRYQRAEERINLLEKLQQRRWEVLVSSSLDDINSNKNDSKGVSPSETLPMEDDPDTRVRSDDKSKCLTTVETFSSSTSSENDDSDGEELEIVDSYSLQVTGKEVRDNHVLSSPLVPSKQISPKSTLDSFFIQQSSKISSIPLNARKKSSAVHSRLALNNLLRAKQFQMGNEWLARELGYSTQEDHIRECVTVETEKQNRVLKKEEERRRMIKQREDSLNKAQWQSTDRSLRESHPGDLTIDEEIKHRTLLRDGSNWDLEAEENVEEDELALARKLDAERNDSDHDSAISDDEHNVSDEENAGIDDDASDGAISEDKNIIHAHLISEDPNKSEHQAPLHQNEIAMLFTETTSEPENGDCTENNQEVVNVASSSSVKIVKDREEAEDESLSSEQDEEKEFDESIDPAADRTDKKGQKKNSAWKALLKKEAEQQKKKNAMRAKRDGLVDAEAEEEDEEDGVAGLEDFGFTIGKKNKEDDEEENDDVKDEDFENIVDDLSEDEGDEEAGEKARKTLEALEEKERHKEILKRVRDGYDGRREGIAGGIGAARGVHRFDQLVAPSNREEAKRIGLLNDDEIDNDSDEEKLNKGVDGEIEDENALLDKNLRERHLRRFESLDEHFSDDEEEEDISDQNSDEDHDTEDEEEKEQERLAKRFEKRARRNRLLEMHHSESQFSQSRLIDEDVRLQRDLKAMKNAHSKSSQNVSAGSLFSRISSQCKMRRPSTADENVAKRQKSNETWSSDTTSSSSKTSTQNSQLSLGLRISNHLNKSKTSFLGSVSSNMLSLSRSNSGSATQSKGTFTFLPNDSRLVRGQSNGVVNKNILPSRG